MDELNLTIVLEKQGRHEEALRVVKSGRGLYLMEDIEAQATAASDQFQQQSNESQHSFTFVRNIILWCCALAVLFFGSSLLLVTTEIKRRSRVERHLRESKSSLARSNSELREQTLKAEPAISAIHLTLQGKGGVGKSLVASILAQYFRHHGKELHCIDSDPVIQTFSQYAELGAEHLALIRNGRIDSAGFDVLIDRLLAEDGIFIVDNGASTFVPLWSYIVENNALETLAAAGRKLYVHTIVTGEQSLGDSQRLQESCRQQG
jgi:hypothetical protein